MQQSGMSVTKYLQHVGINYNTYNYWRKKLKENPDFGDASPCSRVRLLVYFYFLSSMALMFKSGLIR